ncbi:MAG: hypothetical protein DHS20C10_02020 [marine bacterium B5-7]|nr:MAG: hypothetical protein DHS20C10_02020 [marine bacterium B5-7]
MGEDIYRVLLTRKAEKDLKIIPRYIIEKLQIWVELVDSDKTIAFVEIQEVNKHDY